MIRKTLPIILLGFTVLLLLFGSSVNAQEQVVTADEVNAIAKKLYCPVCENIPLDSCGTAACQDWRYEIQLQLEEGKSEQEIITDFVQRFGDRVVGTPQDPVLRALSLVTPWIVILLATIAVIYTLVQLRTRQSPDQLPPDKADHPPSDDYHNLLEQDLSG